MAKRSKKAPRGFLRDHGLGLVMAAVTLFWLLLYLRGNPDTHLGSFYGNATADWLGSLMIVVATKYFCEINSAESRPPHPRSRGAFARFLVDHSLSILLVITGAGWFVAFARMDPGSKTGTVVGNIASEWLQVLGLVVLTKYLGETGSKEGQ